MKGNRTMPMSQVAALAVANAPHTQKIVDDVISLIVSQYLRLRNVDDMGVEGGAGATRGVALGQTTARGRPRSASTAGDDLGSEGNVDKSISTHNGRSYCQC